MATKIFVTYTPTSGSNNGQLSIQVPTNGTNDRSTSLSVTGGGITRSFNINQEGKAITSFNIVDVIPNGAGTFTYQFGSGIVPIGTVLNIEYSPASYDDSFTFSIQFDSTITSVISSNTSALQAIFNRSTRVLSITSSYIQSEMISIALYSDNTPVGQVNLLMNNP